jgi:hypothetical protein
LWKDFKRGMANCLYKRVISAAKNIFAEYGGRPAFFCLTTADACLFTGYKMHGLFGLVKGRHLNCEPVSFVPVILYYETSIIEAAFRHNKIVQLSAGRAAVFSQSLALPSRN